MPKDKIVSDGCSNVLVKDVYESNIAVDEWLKKRIETRTARIAIVGLGYVGLPLAIELGNAGFVVTGIEENPKREAMVKKGENYVLPGDKELAKLVNSQKLSAISNYDILNEIDVICICVPTPLTKNREPNITYIERVTNELVKRLHRGQLIILESTSYPGTTEEIVLPSLTATGLKVGVDFLLAFSPERIDPGNAKFHVNNIPKVVGGVTPQCTGTAELLYRAVTSEVYPASSPRVAEMEKLLENVFRSVNIALVNELAILCKKMEIDVWEVIKLASTKPYGFMPFYPGPGLGGHCIPIDPFYLTWKAHEYDLNTKFIELAGEINSQMPYHVVSLVIDALGSQKKCLNGSKVIVLGVAYKRDIEDWRTSPSIKVMEILEQKGVVVSYNDPHVPEISLGTRKLTSVNLESIADFDCAVICTDHSVYNIQTIVRDANLIVDTRNATKTRGNPKIFVL